MNIFLDMLLGLAGLSAVMCYLSWRADRNIPSAVWSNPRLEGDPKAKIELEASIEKGQKKAAVMKKAASIVYWVTAGTLLVFVATNLSDLLGFLTDWWNKPSATTNF